MSRPPALRVDLRSDTVTRPTAAMLDAMKSAEVGDDVFGDDPTVHALEEAIARRLGKERALFVPSGTMANQLALRASTRPGDEIVAHARSHIYNYESGAPAVLSGLTVRAIDSPDGNLPDGAVRASLHLSADPHLAPTRLIAMENTHNACGGVPLTARAMEPVVAVAREHSLALHLDGARLFNAAVALGEPVDALAAGFDTVSVCFSKGLGAPVGSALAGPSDVIQSAHRFRKMFGGGMRQAGYLCAAALYALDYHVERLALDHARAREFARRLARAPGIVLDAEAVRTNIVYFELEAHHRLAARDAMGTAQLVAAARAHGIGLTGHGLRLRAVFHLDVDDDALELACSTLDKLLAT